MSRAPFSQNIDDAVKHVDRAVFDAWSAKAGEAVERVAKNPAPEMTAMFRLPAETADLKEIETIGTRIAENYTSLVVVGMGGSSLSGETLLGLRKPGGLQMHFVDNIDPHSMALLMETLPWKQTAFLIITKSGTTIETLAQFAVLLREAKARGADVAKAFTIITIPNGNPMHTLANEHGMQVVTHDKDLCGRFSILSSVGLIPAAALGIDIRSLRAGAEITLAENMRTPLAAAGEAAALHMALRDKHIAMHVMMHYCDRFGGLALWHRQCWSESLGKDGQGTTPIRSRGATDQHSQLQLYLEGPRDKLFTALILDMSGQGDLIGFEGQPVLAYLDGHRMGDLAMAEQRATNATLVNAGCPLRTITCAALDETVMGALLMHFTLEVTLTAALMGVNAFNQPAVEAGKKLALEYLAGRA